MGLRYIIGSMRVCSVVTRSGKSKPFSCISDSFRYHVQMNPSAILTDATSLCLCRRVCGWCYLRVTCQLTAVNFAWKF